MLQHQAELLREREREAGRAGKRERSVLSLDSCRGRDTSQIFGIYCTDQCGKEPLHMFVMAEGLFLRGRG